jgi:hypothetical protein
MAYRISTMRKVLHVAVAPAISGCGSGAKSNDPVVVRVGTVAIKESEFRTHTAELARSLTAQGAPPLSEHEWRRISMDPLIRDKAAVQEARRRGYDRHPAVRGVVRGVLMARMLQDAVESSGEPAELPDADIARYYADHEKELTRPR